MNRRLTVLFAALLATAGLVFLTPAGPAQAANQDNTALHAHSTHQAAGSSHRAKQHSRVTVKKIKYGPHGWKLVATVTKDGKAWKNKRTMLQVKFCGSFQTLVARKSGRDGRATFPLALKAGWNTMKGCGVTYSHLPFRMHIAKHGGAPAASSRTFRLVRR